MTHGKVSLLLQKYGTGRAKQSEQAQLFQLLLTGALSSDQRATLYHYLASERSKIGPTASLDLFKWLNGLRDKLSEAGFDPDRANTVVETLRRISTQTTTQDNNRQEEPTISRLTVELDVIIFEGKIPESAPVPAGNSLIVKIAMTLQANYKTAGGLVAAVTGMIAMIWFHAPHHLVMPQEDNRLENPVAVHGKGFRTLRDKTEIILADGSKISYPKRFYSNNRRREILLESGSIYLEVAPDKDRPFFVYTPLGVTVEVKGTGLNVSVNLEEQTVEIAVAHGQVFVHYDGEDIEVQPKQQVTVFANSGDIRADDFDPEDVSWPYPRISFDSVTLETFATEIQKRFHHEVEFKNPDLKSCVINGDFEGESARLENILICLEASSASFSIKTVHKTLVISGNGCYALDPAEEGARKKKKKRGHKL